MFNKKIQIIILLTVNLVLSLKSTSFCRIEINVCQGYYDFKQIYQTKCNLIECSDRFKIKCFNSNICSNDIKECNDYKQLNSNVYIFISKLIGIKSKKRDQLEKFNRHIRLCKNNIYKFNTNDFCVNGLNCMDKLVSLTSRGNKQANKIVDCKCPNELSFKFSKYCTKDSIVCDFSFKSNTNTLFNNIKNCGNGNVTNFRSYIKF